MVGVGAAVEDDLVDLGRLEALAQQRAKGGAIAFTKALAREMARFGINVNCVCPGTIYTPSLERRIQAFADPGKARAEFIARQPMGRLGKDEEIAAAILFEAWRRFESPRPILSVPMLAIASLGLVVNVVSGAYVTPPSRLSSISTA